MSGQTVVGQLVPVALLTGVPVPGDAQTGFPVQRAGRDRHVVAVGRIPEQARAALRAKPAPSVGVAGRAVDPAQAALLVEHEPLARTGGGGAGRAMPAPALDAVADQDVAQRPCHGETDGAAQAAAVCHPLGHAPSPSDSTTRVASPERTASTAVPTS